ncbi:hypothetical protein [Novosphingobium sp.]|uniref:hypothetical protein n=1 Tax=Novosphingobium sp. TaxID=1874826 RepID=UPI00286E6E69|nr:hypothetical protein [Novosphingobium sp.]
MTDEADFIISREQGTALIAIEALIGTELVQISGESAAWAIDWIRSIAEEVQLQSSGSIVGQPK